MRLLRVRHIEDAAAVFALDDLIAALKLLGYRRRQGHIAARALVVIEPRHGREALPAHRLISLHILGINLFTDLRTLLFQLFELRGLLLKFLIIGRLQTVVFVPALRRTSL